MSSPSLLKRIERDAGVPALAEILSGLPPTDLQSLLLEVYRQSAGRRQPSDVLADYQRNRFVHPCKVAPATLLQWETVALSTLPPDFEAIELAPVCPLATCSAIAAVDQNWAVPTARNTEVVSDPTNVMALECALRRKLSPKPAPAVHLACRHRALRPQLYADSAASSHFSLFALCSAGRDTGGRQFELTHFRTHCRFHLAALRKFLGPDCPITVSLTDFGAGTDEATLEREVLAPLSREFPRVTAGMNSERTAGRGYYRDLCAKIHVQNDSGELIEVADGGSVDWTAKLLSDSKERLIISGIGSERVCTLFGRQP